MQASAAPASSGGNRRSSATMPSVAILMTLGGLVGMLVACATFFVSLGIVRGGDVALMNSVDARSKQTEATATEARDIAIDVRTKLEIVGRVVDKLDAKLDRVIEKGK